MPSSARAFVVAFGIAVIADASFPWIGSAAGARQERAVRRIGATVVEGAPIRSSGNASSTCCPPGPPGS